MRNKGKGSSEEVYSSLIIIRPLALCWKVLLISEYIMPPNSLEFTCILTGWISYFSVKTNVKTFYE